MSISIPSAELENIEKLFVTDLVPAMSQESRVVAGSAPGETTARIRIHGRTVSTSVMRPFLQELRFAARGLARKPGFTVLAAMTLSLGIGLATAVFALVHGVLLTSPYPHSERLICVSSSNAQGREDGRCLASTFAAWRNEAKSFEAIAAYWWTFDYRVQPEGSKFMQGLFVTTNYFDLIGVRPLLGRTFLPSEISAKPDPVIILGYDFWQKNFHGDRNVIGQAIHISRYDLPQTVIGIMPPGLRFLPAINDMGEPNYDVDARIDFWSPTHWDENNLKDAECDVVGRLREGLDPRAAQAELTTIADRHARETGVTGSMLVKMQPLTAVLNRDGRKLLLPMFAAVILLFLIGCGNVCGLLLVRGIQRERDYAVRRALGAAPSQLFYQTAAEVAVLALVAGGTGAGLAAALVKIMGTIAGTAIPRLDAVGIHWPVFVMCAGLAALATALTGWMPALRAAQSEPASAIRSGGRTGSAGRPERRLLSAVVAFQITLTLVLLVGAALLIRTVRNLASVKPGFDTRNVLAMSVTPMGKGDSFVDFHVSALARVSALPGVLSAAFAWGVPLTGNKWTGTVTVEGEPEDKSNPPVPERAVTPDYFDALGMSVIAGRGFRSDDNWDNWNSTNKTIVAATDTPFVAIINEAMAKQRFGNANPIGKRFHCNLWEKRAAEVIGVVKDVRNEALAQSAQPEVYFSYWQLPAFTKDLITKTASDPRSLVSAVQRELHAVDPRVAIDHIKTLDQIRAESVAPQTFAMRLLTGFAVAGAALALVGIYSVLSLTVASRHREIAIRMAIGAGRRDIVWLILSEGLKLILIGLVIGSGAALGISRVLRALLFGIEPTDAATFAGVACLFTIIALLASVIPARRAVGINPITALQNQ
jgi:putative ABC transport system permease protein